MVMPRFHRRSLPRLPRRLPPPPPLHPPKIQPPPTTSLPRNTRKPSPTPAPATASIFSPSSGASRFSCLFFAPASSPSSAASRNPAQAAELGDEAGAQKRQEQRAAPEDREQIEIRRAHL